jgi:hypothetical protein
MVSDDWRFFCLNLSPYIPLPSGIYWREGGLIERGASTLLDAPKKNRADAPLRRPGKIIKLKPVLVVPSFYYVSLSTLSR